MLALAVLFSLLASVHGLVMPLVDGRPISTTQTYAISGLVTDTFGNAIGGATVTISGAQTSTTTSDVNGNYSFANLQAGGNYSLTPSIPGRFDTVSFGVSVNNLSSDVRQDLKLTFFSNFQVSVRDSSGNGIASVGIRLNNDSFVFAQTNSFGVANIGVQVPFINSPPRAATFAPQKTGYAFNPASITATTSSSGQSLTFTGVIQANAIDDTQFFVTQNYADFLNRAADAGGLVFWGDQIYSCGLDAACVDVKRVNVSAAFFVSIEFQQTGYLVERIYKAAYGDASGMNGSQPINVPTVRFNEFLPDTQQIGQNVVVGQAGWQSVLETNKQAFTFAFVQRSRFVTAFPATMTPAQFVDQLFTNVGVVPTVADRNAAINEFSSAAISADAGARSRALRDVAENSSFTNQEFNRAFVLMQYIGYLRRNPNDVPDSDYSGWQFWLTKLNAFNGDYINSEMVKAFITSTEYRKRFSQ
jgi:hypothetical protein